MRCRNEGGLLENLEAVQNEVAEAAAIDYPGRLHGPVTNAGAALLPVQWQAGE